MTNDEGIHDPLSGLSLLASAISGRSLRVATGEPGEPAWTNGRVIFIDASLDGRRQIQDIGVQASLLAAGSLDPAIVRRLKRRPALTRRYLALEGHRALAAIGDLLPPSLRSLIDSEIAARVDSPAASLAVARSRDGISDPPESFGSIHARPLLAAIQNAENTATEDQQLERSQQALELTELAEDEVEDEGGPGDVFSSLVGGEGAVGRFLGRMLQAVRKLDADEPPGADAPTHWTRSRMRRGGPSAVSTRVAGSLDTGAFFEGRAAKYPEWDVHRRRYRHDWCTVQEIEPQPDADDAFEMVPGGFGLRRPLARLGIGLDRCHRQTFGDDIDIDAAVEARVELMAGSAPDEAVYVDSLRRRRDLAVLLLLDISGSTSEPAATGTTLHEQQRAVAAALLITLHEIGDRVALYAFSSRGRSAVQLVPVKRFDEGVDGLAMQRLAGLTPGAYSRLGAAVRHGASVLNDRGGTSRRLLVVLSDGLAYDHGYEPAYGAADARRALGEARRGGVGCLCLNIGSSTDDAALRRVFGSAAYATVPMPGQLGRAIGPLFRSALRSAEARRPVSP